jgi:hypothetical protein
MSTCPHVHQKGASNAAQHTNPLSAARVVIEHPNIVTDAELAKILIAFGQQLLSAPPAAPAKTEPHHPKLPPPTGRRR